MAGAFSLQDTDDGFQRRPGILGILRPVRVPDRMSHKGVGLNPKENLS
jgi:hypothetical protein